MLLPLTRILVSDRRPLWAVAAFAPLIGAAFQSEPPAKVSFSREVAPLLKAHCVSCHGRVDPAGKLDLSSPEAIERGGVGGKSIVASDPEHSLLILRIRGGDGRPTMPMGFAPLKAADRAILERWIREGASVDVKTSRHWAYQPLTRPTVPVVKLRKWSRNPIDAFVAQRLEREGLAPSPEADRARLLRRASLDITGLPPTLGELDAFLADRRPDAYERVVDRLLASPAYGERQARFWLDLARYADSDGFADQSRTAWMYRDWVINAFNRNMPFDQFTTEQMAGDLQPRSGSTKEQMDRLVATGFHRNSMFDAEMGGNPEEAHEVVISDRVATTAAVWLGSTLQCAHCHDHKYDPFTQRDYYAMAAFFRGTSYRENRPGMTKGRWLEPELKLPNSTQAAKVEKLQAKIDSTAAAMRRWTPEKRVLQAAWLADLKQQPWKVVRNLRIFATERTRLASLPDGSYLAQGSAPPMDGYTVVLPAQSEPVSGIRIEAIPDKSLPKGGSGRSEAGGFLIADITLLVDGKVVPIAAAVSDAGGADFPANSLLNPDPKKRGWGVQEDVETPHELVIEFAHPIDLSRGATLRIDHTFDDASNELGRFRISQTSVSKPTRFVAPLAVREKLGETTLKKDDQTTRDEAFFASASDFAAERERIRLAEIELASTREVVPSAMILQEYAGKKPLTTVLRLRGEYTNPGPVVEASTPAVLPAMEPAGRKDRLALAKWLVSPENPLTARVEVNRVWEQYFGQGIVETSEDFGIRGATPSHPELLDYLANRLIDSGWDLKALHRLIATSSTYRQASNGTASLRERDPKNVLLARGPRGRMDAEAIRDTALACSGTLSTKIGGPSVFPYQPKQASEGGTPWHQSPGLDAQRRSLYTFLRRTSPYPMFQVFDATSRSECTVRRVRTTTPLQALALLNDEGMLDAARALGMRMLGAAQTDQARLRLGFRICTARLPRPSEAKELANLVTRLRGRYAADVSAARKLAGSPERATWTMVANVLLNLDETISKN